MSDLLLINASPRREASESLRIATELVEAMREIEPALAIDRLDLFEDPPPAFGAKAALAKMDVIAGREVEAERQHEWEQALETAERLRSAKLWVLAVPMWNSGLPWPLKQLIDTVTQPGVAFAFDPDSGYRACLAARERSRSTPARSTVRASQSPSASITTRPTSTGGSSSSGSSGSARFACNRRSPTRRCPSAARSLWSRPARLGSASRPQARASPSESLGMAGDRQRR